MNRVLKIGVISLAVVAGLAVAAVGGTILYLQNADLRQLMVNLVKSQTGLELQLDGAVTVQLFPTPVLQAEQMTIPAFQGETPLFNVRNVKAELAWGPGPLYVYGIGLTQLTMDDPTIYLYHPKTGLANWESAYRGQGFKTGGGSSAGGGDVAIPFSRIGNVNINNLTFTYIDEQTETDVRLMRTNLTVTGQENPQATLTGAGQLNGQTLELNFTAQLANMADIPLKGTLKVAGSTVNIDGSLKDGAFEGRVAANGANLSRTLETLTGAPVLETPQAQAFEVST